MEAMERQTKNMREIDLRKETIHFCEEDKHEE